MRHCEPDCEDVIVPVPRAAAERGTTCPDRAKEVHPFGLWGLISFLQSPKLPPVQTSAINSPPPERDLLPFRTGRLVPISALPDPLPRSCSRSGHDER